MNTLTLKKEADSFSPKSRTCSKTEIEIDTVAHLRLVSCVVPLVKNKTRASGGGLQNRLQLWLAAGCQRESLQI